MVVENHSFVFHYVVRRGAKQKPEPLGVSLVFENDAPSGLCYCHVGEIQNNGVVFRKNGRLQKLPEVANQQLQAYDRLLSVNGRRDYKGMSSELHCARTLHLHVLREEGYQQQQPEKSNPSLIPGGSHMMISQQQRETINSERAPGSETDLVNAKDDGDEVPQQLTVGSDATAGAVVVEVGVEAGVFDVGGRFVVVTEYSGDDLEPEHGYISLSLGEFVEVHPGSRQQGDKNNRYREYVYGTKADGLQEWGWLPAAVIRTDYT